MKTNQLSLYDVPPEPPKKQDNQKRNWEKGKTMNKWQKKKSREIKALVRHDKFGRLSYKDARRIWRFAYRFPCFSPCEDCDNPFCDKPKNALAYCPERK